MISRAKLGLGVGVVLGLLLANTVYLSGKTVAGNVKRSFTEAWAVPLGGVQSIVRTQVKPGEGALLVMVSPAALSLVGDDGQQRRRLPPAGALAAAATGDLTGDGVDEIVTLNRLSGQAALRAFDGDLKPLWSVTLEEGAPPARVLIVDLDGDKQRDVVAGFEGGRLRAVSSRGRPLWSWAMPEGPTGEDAALRGLDDVKGEHGERRVALARRDGRAALLDGRGQALWTDKLPAQVRRLRSLDLGDGEPALLVGCEDGTCWRLRGAGKGTGESAFKLEAAAQIGEPVTEVRALEADGNALTREVVLGGKKGRVVVVGSGQADVDGKVSAIAGVDLDADGRDEIVVGTEEGLVSLLDASGGRLASLRVSGKVDAIVGLPGNAGSRRFAVASASRVVAYEYDVQGAPVWYRPASAAALGLLGIVGVALGLARLKAPPAPAQAAARDVGYARRAKLEQALARVQALLGQGQAAPADAQERIAQLQQQLHALDREAARAARPVVASPPPPPRQGT